MYTVPSHKKHCQILEVAEASSICTTEERICSVEGCGTKLTMWNHSNKCFLHRRTSKERKRDRMSKADLTSFKKYGIDLNGN